MIKLKTKNINMTIEKQRWTMILGNDPVELKRILDTLNAKLMICEGEYVLGERDVSTFSQREIAHFRKKEVINFSDENFLMKDFTVEKNLQLQLKFSGIYPTKAKRIITGVLEELEMKNIRDFPIPQLSVIQNLQVRLAKSMVVEPKLICGVDPFLDLNEEEEQKLRGWIEKIIQRGATVVMVTKNPQHLSYGEKEFIMGK